MKKEMLINVLQPEECRIAIVEDGVLEELYVERTSQESYVGNIYKGRIVNIEPSIQAAFVDFGIGRNGFLHVSDVDPVYYKHLLPKELLEQLEAEEQDDEPRSRPSRSERDSQRPRVTFPESSVTVPSTPAATPSVTPVSYVEPDDEEGFVEGLEDATPGLAATVAPPTNLGPAPVAERADRPPPAEPEEDSEFAADLFEDALPAKPADQPVATSDLPAIIVPVVASPKVVEVPEIDEFSAGLDEVTPAPVEPSPSATAEPVTLEVSPSGVDSSEGSEEAEKAEVETKAKKPKKSAKPKKVSEDTAPAEVDDESKAKAKPRRTKKKTEADPEEPDGDDKPRPMPGAERRTTGSDDPEIQPFFGSSDDDFDINAPNDRFLSNTDDAGQDLAESEDVDEDAEEDVELLESVVEPSEEVDEDEFAPPIRKEQDRERGGRGGRGPRGGGRSGRPK